ncbi:MAG: hypothetical protein JO056_00195 [Alphaproteobacteria bacterium]|nr:hypothetical protein [Alphaproteobacteria bacterium]
MLRLIGGVAAGIVAWFVIVTILNLGLRYSWPDYHAVEKALTFTLPMMIARLSESGVSSIASGYVAATVSRNRFSALGSGVLLLIPFGYYHLAVIWDRFPPWYHLAFLVSLIVLSWLGGLLANRRPALR